MYSNRAPRSANLYLWAGVVLFVVFAGLAYGMWRSLQNRFISDEQLLRELGDAEFVEEPQPATNDWPQWRGVRRDGVAFSGPLRTDWPNGGPPELWNKDITDNEDNRAAYSSFAVANGRVFTMLRKNEKEAIVCWNLDDGTEKWQEEYDPQLPKQIEYGNGPRSTPTYYDGRLYTVGSTGRLQCRQADNGSLLWEHDLRGEYGAVMPRWGIAFSPLVDDQYVYTSPGGPNGMGFVAIDRVTGKEAWATQDEASGYSSPVAITVGGERQIVFFAAHHLVGLDPRSGALRWRYPWETFAEVNAATPVTFRTKVGGVERTYVLITSGYRRGCALIAILPESTGGFSARRVFESSRLQSHHGSPVRVGDHVYGFSETTLVCMSLRTGEVAWSKSGYKKGTLLAVGEYLLVLGEEGKLALLKATPSKDEVVVEAPRVMGRRCWTMPVLAEGRLLLRDEDKVRCLDMRQH
jgi:outer membrane protein assembly factor BamB